MSRIGGFILKLLGIVLIGAACLKWQQLYTTPVAEADIWTNRSFLMAQFAGELAFGLWLVSGLFKKPAWLMALLCFVAFSLITGYKWYSGAASCGCFGNVIVEPWKTLFAMDLPAVILLLIFHPKKRGKWFTPWPSRCRLGGWIVFGVLLVGVSTTVLALHVPPEETEEYTVLSPDEWAGDVLPIFDSIDVADEIRSGEWLLFFHRHDCHVCQELLPEYKEFAVELDGFLQTAFIAIPPIEPDAIEADAAWVLGQLDATKEWWVSTPVIVLLSDGVVLFASEGEELSPEEVRDTYMDILNEE